MSKKNKSEKKVDISKDIKATVNKDGNSNVEESTIKRIIRSNSFKILGVTALVGVSLCGGFIAGREFGINSPATIKYYSNNKTIATVGDITIKEKELKDKMKVLFYSRKNEKISDEEIKEYEQSFVEFMVSAQVLKQKAIKDGISVSEEELEENYKSLIQQLESFVNLKEDEFLAKFKLTKEEIKASLEAELLSDAYLEANSQVTDKEVEEYYNSNIDNFKQVQASHILFKTVGDNYEPLSDEEKAKAKEKGEEVLKKALAGEDFAKLAKEYSEDGSAQNGGDLGLFGKGEMVEVFETTAFALKTNEIHPELVESQYGYHIIKRTGEGISSLEDKSEEIKNNLITEKKYKILDEAMKSPDINIKYKY